MTDKLSKKCSKVIDKILKQSVEEFKNFDNQIFSEFIMRGAH